MHLITPSLVASADIVDTIEAQELWQSSVEALMAATTRIHFESGAQFEECVRESISDPMMMQITNFVCLLVQSDMVYGFVKGDAELYVARRSRVVPVLHQETFAVGRAIVGDVFLLTTKASTQALEAHSWRQVLINADGQVADDVSTVNDTLHTLSTHGVHVRALVARLVFEPQDEIGVPVTAATAVHRASDVPVQKEPKSKITLPKIKRPNLSLFSKREIMVRGGIAVLAVALILTSVALFKRHASTAESKKIAVVREYVEQQIKLSSQVSSLNNARARSLLQEAGRSIADLEKTLGKDNPDVVALRDLLKKKQAEITNDKRKAEDFFDLTVEQASAKGTLMAQDGDTVAILDPEGYVYLVNLKQKSLTKRKLPNAGEAASISVSDGVVYALIPGRGVAEIDKTGESKKVISSTSEWKSPTSILSYGSNLYLLDPQANQMFRYASTDTGFDKPAEYFRSKVALGDVQTAAIDGSVYLGFAQSIVKYTSGLQDGFSPQFGTDNTSIHQLVTSADLDELYVWDRDHGVVQALTKNGAFRFQASSDVLKTATAIAIYDGSVIALRENKLYKISLINN